ncbi:MAG: hypothetical protein Kow0090_14300 [Myxococcota bacterium]
MLIEKKEINIASLHSDHIFFLAISSNQINSSFRGKLSAANAYLVGYQENYSYNLFAYLYYREIAEAQVFTPETHSASRASLQRYQYAGLDFLEAMGFIMEPINLKAMTPKERNRFINSMPFMHHNELKKYATEFDEERSSDYLLSGPKYVDSSQAPLTQDDGPFPAVAPTESESQQQVDDSIWKNNPQISKNVVNLSEDDKNEMLLTLGKLLASF